MVAREPRVQPPILDAYSDMPLFNTKAVVHQTGVPAPTLRAWERRYSILSPRRGENDYRLYSERDMMMVSWLRERVETGMTISQAIALLRSLEPARRNRRRGGKSAASALAEGETPVAAAPALDHFAVKDLGTSLITQFANLDEYSASRTITQALAVFSIEDVCLQLFTPVLVEIGRQWAGGQLSVTVEHFASALIRCQLESLFRAAAAGEQGPLVLVGCAPGELHELGALTVALFLRRAGMRVAYLGQNCESETLAQTAATLRAAAIVLSAMLPPQADALAEVGRRLREVPSQPSFYFGGQAFSYAPGLAEKIPGTYLAGNARDAIVELKNRLVA
jgi:MerR family transcriptional regulator, light-induced transcriptional regulator